MDPRQRVQPILWFILGGAVDPPNNGHTWDPVVVFFCCFFVVFLSFVERLSSFGVHYTHLFTKDKKTSY